MARAGTSTENIPDRRTEVEVDFEVLIRLARFQEWWIGQRWRNRFHPGFVAVLEGWAGSTA